MSRYTMSKSTKVTDTGQSGRFLATARALGADEDEATFRAKLGVIARQKPKDEPKPAKARGKRAKAAD
jgi:hypothetical protein